MSRLFCPLLQMPKDKIIISDPGQIHHLKNVLRLKVNNEVVVCDGKGNEYISLIQELTAQKITLKIKDTKKAIRQERTKITVACAIPKKSKFDDIVDKLTQLGVDRIIPLLTERVIVKWDSRKKIAQQKRWEKIALYASQQSQRNNLPVIEPIKNIREVLIKSENYDLKLIPTLTDKRKILKEVFIQIKPKNILVLIGPEGDFTDGEVDLAKKYGCIPVSLGDLVLRVDTAAAVVVSYIMLSFT